MNITISPQARIYTWKEVRELLDKQRKAMIDEVSKKQDVIADALLYDELLTQEYLTLEALRRMGFQKGALNNYLSVKSGVADEINGDSLDYSDMEKGIDGLLGYHLTDKGLTESLKERASR